MSIDTSELKALANDLAGAGKRVRAGSSRAVTKGAALIKREMKTDARNARRRSPTAIPHLPDAITSEKLSPLEAEIGMGPGTGTGGQGSLAHIIVYGSVNNAPVYDHMDGPRRTLPAQVKLFEVVAEDSVLGEAE